MTGSLPVGAPQRSRHLGPFLWTFISSFSSRRRKKKVSVTVLLDVMESREQGTHTHQSPERGKTRQAATFSDSASDQWRKNDTERRCLNFFLFSFPSNFAEKTHTCIFPRCSQIYIRMMNDGGTQKGNKNIYELLDEDGGKKISLQKSWTFKFVKEKATRVGKRDAYSLS